jgi:hypothetical protein
MQQQTTKAWMFKEILAEKERKSRQKQSAFKLKQDLQEVAHTKKRILLSTNYRVCCKLYT